MKVKEIKIHMLRGLMRPEYFYIPVPEREDEKLPIRFKFTDEDGNDVFVSAIYLSYNTYSWLHDLYQDESGRWISVYDQYSKGYAFDADYDWRFPVPDPSDFEIYPIPDFNNIDIKADGGTVDKGSTYVRISFDEPQTLIELENLPSGIYYISVNGMDIVKPRGYNFTGTKYYPGYYADEYDDSEHYLSDYNSYGMIDRSGRFSGYYTYSLYNKESPYQPTGYNFYGISKKFEDNTMPIVCGFSQINITSEPNITVCFKLINPYDKSDPILQSGFSASSDIGVCYWRGYATRDELSDIDTFEMTLTDIDSASDNMALKSGYVRESASYRDPILYTENTVRVDNRHVCTVTIAELEPETECDASLFRAYSSSDHIPNGLPYDALFINDIQPGRYRLAETGNNRFARVFVNGAKSDALNERSDLLLQRSTVTVQEYKDEIMSAVPVPEGDIYIETVKEQYDNIEFEVYKEHMWGDVYITKLRIPESRRDKTYDDLEAEYYIAETSTGIDFVGRYNRNKKEYLDEYQFSSDGTYYIRNYIENATVKNEIHVIHNVPKVDFAPALVNIPGVIEDGTLFTAIKLYVDDEYRGYFTSDWSFLDTSDGRSWSLRNEADIEDLDPERGNEFGADKASIPYTDATRGSTTYGSRSWFPCYLRTTVSDESEDIKGSVIYSGWSQESSRSEKRYANIIYGDGLTFVEMDYSLRRSTLYDSWGSYHNLNQRLKRQNFTSGIPEWSTYHTR